MLALVGLIEGFVAWRHRDLTQVPTFDWSVTNAVARVEANDARVLCFGDSLVKFGVVPRVIEDRLGLRTFNLAVCGGQPPSSYFLLRRAIESGARPTTVIVDFVPHLLMHGVRHNLRQWPELLDTRELVELAWTTKSAEFAGELALGQFLYSLRDRSEIRFTILQALRGRSASYRPIMPHYLRNWEVNRGAQINPCRPYDFDREDLRRWEDYRGDSAWACHPLNRDYLRRFLDLASAHGIRVVWLMPPVSPVTQARRERLGVDRHYERFVRQMVGGYRNVLVLDATHSGYGPGVFFDPVHLDRHGAVNLTADIADALRRGPESSRWVRLPEFRERTIRVAIEDIRESRAVFQNVATAGGNARGISVMR